MLNNRRGVFVVELMGSGKQSRAVIRKGVIRYVEQLTSAGHAFYCYDEVCMYGCMHECMAMVVHI